MGGSRLIANMNSPHRCVDRLINGWRRIFKWACYWFEIGDSWTKKKKGEKNGAEILFVVWKWVAVVRF